MSGRFEGRTAIVTGAASGIGLATAKQLASEGANVLIADVNTENAESAAKQIGSTAWSIGCDVSNELQVEAAVNSAIERHQRLDVVVNNAGLMIFKRFEEHTDDDWIKILRVDLLGAFFFTKQAFLKMKRGGAVVNVASIHAEETTPNVCSYAAAKAAVVSITRSAAIEGKAKGIRVNAVLPGAIDTPMLWNNPNVISGTEAVDKRYVGRPEDVAAAIAYLASDDAAFIEGAMLRVDGGRLDRL